MFFKSGYGSDQPGFLLINFIHYSAKHASNPDFRPAFLKKGCQSRFFIVNTYNLMYKYTYYLNGMNRRIWQIVKNMASHLIKQNKHF